MRRIFVVLGLAAFVLGGFVPSAGAHGVSDTADFRLAQSFAGNELTFVVRKTLAVPGPLNVDIIAHDPVRVAQLDVGLLGSTDKASIRLERRGSHSVRLSVDRTGPWELQLAAGEERARIPFRVMTSRLTAWEPVAYGALATTGACLAIALITAVTVRRRLVIALPAAAGVLALAVAITAALLSPAIPPAQAEGAVPIDPTGGRPYLNTAVETDRKPETGKEFQVRLKLTDGNTGRPADDLNAHHDALAHLVVSSVDGQAFRHLHPVRTAPGELAVRMTLDRPGQYLVYAELERVNSGSQLATGRFEVTGPEQNTMTVPQQRQATAGQSQRIEVNAGGKADLQPWLGMAGHLVLRDESGDFFGHVHEMSMRTSANADETVATLAPDLRFTFTFPKPGRYFGWVQYQRNFVITTVPLVINVTA